MSAEIGPKLFYPWPVAIAQIRPKSAELDRNFKDLGPQWPMLVDAVSDVAKFGTNLTAFGTSSTNINRIWAISAGVSPS